MNSATKERFIKAGISSEEKMEKRVHEEIQLSVVSDNRLDMKSIRVQFEVWLSRQKIQCWSYIPARLGKILCQFCTSEEVELLVTDSAADAKMIDSPQKSGFSVAIVKKAPQ